MKCIIYHNQKCSKSRETLELLQNRGLNPTIIEYLKNSPKVDELEKIISRLKINPKHLVNFKESKAKELGISANDSLTYKQWMKILTKNPELIEIPIIVTSKGAVIDRPPENVLKVLD